MGPTSIRNKDHRSRGALYELRSGLQRPKPKFHLKLQRKYLRGNPDGNAFKRG